MSHHYFARFPIFFDTLCVFLSFTPSLVTTPIGRLPCVRHYACATSLSTPFSLCDCLTITTPFVRLPYRHYSLCASFLRALLPLYDFLVIAMPLVSLPFLHHFPCTSSLSYKFSLPFSFCVLLVISGAFH